MKPIRSAINIIELNGISSFSHPFAFSLEEVEFFEERAAIMEYDGGMSREEAERRALEQLLRWRIRISA